MNVETLFMKHKHYNESTAIYIRRLYLLMVGSYNLHISNLWPLLTVTRFQLYSLSLQRWTLAFTEAVRGTM